LACGSTGHEKERKKAIVEHSQKRIEVIAEKAEKCLKNAAAAAEQFEKIKLDYKPETVNASKGKNLTYKAAGAPTARTLKHNTSVKIVREGLKKDIELHKAGAWGKNKSIQDVEDKESDSGEEFEGAEDDWEDSDRDWKTQGTIYQHLLCKYTLNE
jgi:hypothetical protein